MPYVVDSAGHTIFLSHTQYNDTVASGVTMRMATYNEIQRQVNPERFTIPAPPPPPPPIPRGPDMWVGTEGVTNTPADVGAWGTELNEQSLESAIQEIRQSVENRPEIRLRDTSAERPVFWNTVQTSESLRKKKKVSPTMDITNKEKVPQYFDPNPLAEIPPSLYVFNIRFYKSVLDALHNNRPVVKMEYKRPRPVFPNLLPPNYTPMIDVNKRETYADGYTTWQYYDQWKNKVVTYTDVEVRKLAPKESVTAWDKFRLDLLGWDSTKLTTVDVPIAWAFKMLQVHMNNRWQAEARRLQDVYGAYGREAWATAYNDLNPGGIHINGNDFNTIFNAVLRNNRFSYTSFQRVKTSLPKQLRPRKSSNFTGLHYEQNILTYFRMLYFTKYKADLPGECIYFNNWQGMFDWPGPEGTTIIWPDALPGTEGSKRYTIPMRWINNGLFSRCTCCNNMNDAQNLYWLDPKYTKYIEFHSPVQASIRRKDRQTAFIEAQRGKVVVKSSKYYDMPKEPHPDFMFGVVGFLNHHVDEFDKNKGAAAFNNKPSSGGIADTDQFGINHRQEDTKAMSMPNDMQYVNAGWADTENRKKFIFVCHTCYKNNVVRYADGMFNPAPPPPQPASRFETLDRIVGKSLIKRDFRKVIHKHGTSPLSVIPDAFKLGKGESQRLSNIQVWSGTGKSYKVISKDVTLYMGVELEAAPIDAIYTHLVDRCDLVDKSFAATMYNEVKWVAANIVAKWQGEHPNAILTEDSSTGNGFELVTCPGTHQWHMEEAWKGFFKEDYEDPDLARYAPSAWLNGWVNNGKPTKNKYLIAAGAERRPICGIHIHVSRDAISPLQLGKMKYFVNTHQKFIEHIAGRTSEKYAMYIPSKVKDGLVHKHKTEGNRGNLSVHGRYTALNLDTGKPTFEFRIFRSNVSKAGFMKNIDFVHALVTWCGAVSSLDEKNLTVANFVDWCSTQRGTYKWLTKWLIQTKYIKNIHKFNPKFSKEYGFADDSDENDVTPSLKRRA